MFNPEFIKFKKGICLRGLSRNPNPIAVHFLEHNPNIIDWDYVSEYRNKALNQLIEQNINKINWPIFSQYAPQEIVEKNLDKVVWKYLSANENAGKILEKNLDKNINWELISLNQGAIDIIENELFEKKENFILKNFFNLKNKVHRIHWVQLSSNPSAIHILKNNINKIYWSFFCDIENPEVVKIIEENIDKINNDMNIEDCWYHISKNKYAIHLLEKYSEKINLNGVGLNINAIHLIKNIIDNKLYIDNDEYGFFCAIAINDNPKIIPIIRENLNKIAFFNDASQMLMENPNAIQIIESIINNTYDASIDFSYIKNEKYVGLSANSNAIHLLFDCNYDAIKKHFYETYGKELVEKIYHPKNAHLWLDL